MTEQPQDTTEPRRRRPRPKPVRLVVAMAPPVPLALAPMTTKATALRAFEERTVMSKQAMIPGCGPVEPPKLTAEEQAERERIEVACKAHATDRQRREAFELEQAAWRRRAEEVARRHGMTQLQRDDEDRAELMERWRYLLAFHLSDDPADGDMYTAGQRDRFVRLFGRAMTPPIGLAALRTFVDDADAVIERMFDEDEAVN